MKPGIIALSILLAGCSALDQKRENYARAAGMAANPEKIRIVYERDGGDATFVETRCTGRLCEGEGK